MNVKNLSDKVLLEQCVKFGREALLWRNKFRALLPEVERRRLYVRKGYKSVYEFGERLAGLSMAQVAESLNVAGRLEDKPVLKSLLESGEVSVNKIIRVMSIATIENESELAEKVQLLSKNALEVFVRDVKLSQESASNSLPGQTFVRASHSLELDCDVEQELLRLQEKGIDINQLLREALGRREQGLVQTKDRLATQLPESSSRYIPAKVRNVIQQEYGNICASERCMKPSTDVHHTRRFGLNPSHNPNFMAPLCKEHHQIAHSLDVRYQELRRRE